MSEYQCLTSEIQVPKEWSVEARRKIIIDLVKVAIYRHRLGRKVVLSIGEVSALVTDNGTRPGYVLKKIEEIDDQNIYRIELLMPVKIQMFNLIPDGQNFSKAELLQVVPSNLKSNHPISKVFMRNPDHHRVVTVVPNLKRILDLKGITGPEKDNFVLRTTYRVNKIEGHISLMNELDQSTSTSEHALFMEQVSEDEWDVVSYDSLLLPQ